MQGDYGSMVWVNDDSGKEFVCTANPEHLDERNYESLTSEERETCVDVNQMVGTERW